MVFTKGFIFVFHPEEGTYTADGWRQVLRRIHGHKRKEYAE
jgi:hypothetical protein